MATHCVTCAGKTNITDTVQIIPVAIKVNMNQILPHAFKRMTYIGPTGTVKTAVDNISYGHRVQGEPMFVHYLDLKNSPKFWVETSEYVPPKKPRRRKSADATE